MTDNDSPSQPAVTESVSKSHQSAAPSIRVVADIADQWTWAASVAKIPQISGLGLSATAEIEHVRVTATLVDGENEVGRSVLADGGLRAGDTRLGDKHLPLAAGLMAQIDERRPLRCVLEVRDGSSDEVLASHEEEVDLLPHDVWYAMGDPRQAEVVTRARIRARELHEALEGESDDARRADLEQEFLQAVAFISAQKDQAAMLGRALLVAFARPNHPEVAALAREAADIREITTGDAKFAAFQVPDVAEAEAAVEASINAIYETLRARQISYSEPPPGWDLWSEGQRIRDHGAVARGGLGTCMDTTVLMAAVIEHVGLHPLFVLSPGHIFIGYWRRDPFGGSTAPEWYPNLPVVDDLGMILNLYKRGFIGLIETTVFTRRENEVSAHDARQAALANIARTIHEAEDDPTRLVALIDVALARQSGVSPLPAVHQRADGVTEVVEYRPGGAAPVVTEVEETEGPTGDRVVDTHPKRYRTWKSSLFSLNATNALLNLGNGPTVQPILLPGTALGELEDRLNQDVEFSLHSGWEISEIHAARGVPNVKFLDDDEKVAFLRQKKIFIQRESTTRSSPGPVSAAKYLAEIRSMARRAKEAQDERGMNPLFLCIGMLRWEYKKEHFALAPLILVPVRIGARRGSKQFTLSLDTASHATPNIALIQWLKQEHDVTIGGLAEPAADRAGIDVDGVIAAVRNQVAAHGMNADVVEEARLAVLDLSAFRMWSDLNLHADAFLENPLVNHLVHTPAEVFIDRAAPADDAAAIAARIAALDELETPIPADGTQKQAVVWAREGRTFVLQGPPGTGKSQTITNMVAECMLAGKRVLFVAEKGTALAVVQRRLDAIGLSPFTLNLHHEGSSAAEVRAQLKRSLDSRVQSDSIALEAARRQLRNARFELGQYPERLHAANAAGFSAYSAHDQLLVLGDGPTMEIPTYLVAHKSDQVRAIQEIFAGIQQWTSAAGVRADHPWRFAGSGRNGTVDVKAASAAVHGVLDGAAWAQTTAGELHQMLEEAARPAQLDVLALAANPSLPAGDVLERVLDAGWPQTVKQTLADAEQAATGWRERLRGFSPQVIDTDLRALATALEAATASGMFGRSKRQAAALQPLHADAPGGQPIEPAVARTILTDLIAAQDAANSIRHAVAKLPGVAPTALWNPLEPGAFAPLHHGAGALTAATAGLRGTAEWDSRVRGLAVRGELTQHHESLSAYASSWHFLLNCTAAIDSDLEAWLGGRSLAAAVRHHAPVWRTHVDHERLLPLQRWCELARRLQPLADAGLTKPRNDLLDGTMPAYIAEDAFTRGVALASQKERITAAGLDHFDSVAHDQRVQSYAAAEAEIRRQWISAGPAQLIDRRGGGGAGKQTGGLARELEKTRNRLGTRAILRRYGAAVQELTPLVLCSPASAVDLIEPGVMDFDVAIFDEASQITVPEAIGAMGRAKAAIVVGDSKQMPPTRKVGLQTASDDELDDPDAEEPIEDQESILSECELARVSTLKLSWHYRSQDEALIAFSNGAYYGGGLSSFPTPTLLSTATGVELRRIDGHFIRSGSSERVELREEIVAGSRTNPEEAEAIVAAVREVLRGTGDQKPSIGIVTFNEQQRQLIEDLLRADGDPLIARAMDEAQMGPTDVLFIKALEQVQGDERDIVMFSVAFSKQANGKVPLNFGPLSNIGGERRLNVAVTRARRKNIVFCSFDPDELEADKAMYLGVKDLKRFLQFARAAGKGQDVAETADRKAVRDRHRDDIAAAFRSAGLHVLTDVGLSDFRLDLVLSRPERPDRVILPVLLDGETWRSRTTVSDRDVLPVEVLSNLMGWPAVARVWWPMWLQNRDHVIDTILAAVESAEAALDASADQPEPPLLSEPELEVAGPAQIDEPSPAPFGQPHTLAPLAGDGRQPVGETPPPPVAPAPRPPVATAPPTPVRVPTPVPGLVEPPRVEAPSTPRVPAVTPSAGDSGIAPYVAWSDSGLQPADEAPTDELMDALEQIVLMEGPILAELAYRRYIHASGGKRLGPALKRVLNQATAKLVRAQRLAELPDDLPGQITKTLYAPESPAVVVREIGDRQLHEVPRSEVRALIGVIGLDFDDPDVKRRVLSTYGRVALTQAADTFLESCLTYRSGLEPDKSPAGPQSQPLVAPTPEPAALGPVADEQGGNDGVVELEIDDLVDELLDAMAEAMSSGESGELEVGACYIQWVGFPSGDGVHIEASDGGGYDQPMAPALVEALADAGWGRPDTDVRNCWFQITDPGQFREAGDLVRKAIPFLLEHASRS